MEKLQFKLEAFEGPLDLLLFLISKHKLDIYDIEIAELLKQYMDYINEFTSSDLEVASEFLEMAARLVYIKSVALLPKHDEADELKRELTGQLLEYQACKDAANKLAQRNEGFSCFVREAEKLPIDQTYTREHKSEELVFAYMTLIGKAKRKLPPPMSAFSAIVTRRVVSVTSRIVFILKKLYKNNEAEYLSFYQISDRSELVATFLAMLELVKANRIMVSETGEYIYSNKKTAEKNDGH